MKQHSASELRYTADLYDAANRNVLAAQVGAAITDMSGRQLEQAQLVAAETTHMILLRYADGIALPNQGFIRVTDPGTAIVTVYTVDYIRDPREPRPRVWLEVYCHAMRTNS